ncbi:MAG: hypothetical protein OHK93_005013 [Ramalina farinacea]|uniref:Uncharacterized protein n=1 Tax=Ramalina farinacea TaxID=258253 RepID=A0AA43QVA9_9LECA|nr:hypothetical protein [Ramalina farinacea]
MFTSCFLNAIIDLDDTDKDGTPSGTSEPDNMFSQGYAAIHDYVYEILLPLCKERHNVSTRLPPSAELSTFRKYLKRLEDTTENIRDTLSKRIDRKRSSPGRVSAMSPREAWVFCVCSE